VPTFFLAINDQVIKVESRQSFVGGGYAETEGKRKNEVSRFKGVGDTWPWVLNDAAKNYPNSKVMLTATRKREHGRSNAPSPINA